VKIVLG
jgi:hypothetical protein